MKILFQITCAVCVLLFASLFVQLTFYPASFLIGTGMLADASALVVTRRAGVLMLGISCLMANAALYQSARRSRFVSLSMMLVLFGLAGLGYYELLRGTVSEAIHVAIIIESTLGFSFLLCLIVGVKPSGQSVSFSQVPPEESGLVQHASQYDYCDVLSRSITSSEEIKTITQKLFELPGWVYGLLKLRNILVKPFGLATESKGQDGLPFPPIVTADNEIIMFDEDKHLKFWMSILKTERGVSVTTLVSFKITFGKVYFYLIQPFHVLIIKAMLRRWNP